MSSDGFCVGNPAAASQKWPGIAALSEVVHFLRAADNPLLRREQRECPQIREFIFRPYLNNLWGLQRRLWEIANHYRLIERRAPFLDVPHGEYRDLVHYAVAGDVLRIVMDRPDWMRREGQIGISLFLGLDRLYTAMLHLSGTADQLQLIVGNLQGDGRDRLAVYKRITKTMHGMRPRDFLVHIVRILADELRCREILGVSDAGHRSSHPLSRAKKVASYDRLWLEHGAVRHTEHSFFTLTPGLQRRTDLQIPPNKRGMYRRRYQLLSELQHSLREQIARVPLSTLPGIIDKPPVRIGSATAQA